MGKNVEAIGCLDRVVGLEAERAFDLAVDAWTLAEVLRQGGGAETLADDLRFACTMTWKPGNTSWLLDEFPEIQRVPTPRAPGARAEDAPEIEVFEWLDRPVASLADQPRAAGLAADGPGERLYQRSNASALEPPGREPRTGRGGALPAARERRRLGPA